ncbi:three-Cys-motif partner protein TcmP [Marinobacter koreensis]|uniref:Three-Cys-motif partner protein TcmP n=1 Tax=Marinobacter koreensis TaxID=335974 RepID=A0ABW0RHP4_9GAMM|nr:three-Cys-motif partner protein TcmP [Marinobacter koreensis]MCK7547152.1 three-Cys-motif partner protein TcmP [Marinobacter koreensis]
MTKHEFGGPWTQLKLDVFRDYVRFFTTALKNKNFNLHYADAFAGTGNQNLKTEEGQPVLFPEEDFEGSVRVALSLNESFQVYHFNDISEEFCQQLHRLSGEYPGVDVRITQLDANDFVREFCAGLGSNDRAVLLLDPYNTELDWESLKVVASSQRIDLWLLFPLSTLLRMTPRDGNRIRPEWEATLNRLLGTDRWITELYKPKEAPQIEDMFGAEPESEVERLNVDGVSKFVKNRLSEQFPFVSDPVTLRNNNSPLFLFFLAVSNPSNVAIGLARKVSGQIIKKYSTR